MPKKLTPQERAWRAVKEKELQGQIIVTAEMYGWRVVHFADSRKQVKPGVFVGDSQAKGFPDLLLARPPELIAWELKREVQAPVTPEQQEWLDTLAGCGVESAVIRPSNFDECVRRLRKARVQT